MVERLIRTIKEEESYVNDYLDPLDAQRKLDVWRYTVTMNAHTRPWDIKRLQNYLGWNKAMKLVIFLENGGEIKKVVLT